jgi:hypothetical protein
VVNTKIMVRDAAKIMTDHPIADFLAFFSMLTSSPLAAGLGFPHYYIIVRKPSSLEEDISALLYFFNL